MTHPVDTGLIGFNVFRRNHRAFGCRPFQECSFTKLPSGSNHNLVIVLAADAFWDTIRALGIGNRTSVAPVHLLERDFDRLPVALQSTIDFLVPSDIPCRMHHIMLCSSNEHERLTTHATEITVF